jgi:hypothetical protein
LWTGACVTIIGEVGLQHEGCWKVVVYPDFKFRYLVFEREIEWTGKFMWASQ